MQLNIANDQAATKALEEQKRGENEAIAEQQEVKDKLTAEAADRNKAQLADWYANKDAAGLPAAPKEPALTEGGPQQEREGKQALEAYKEAGFLHSPDKTPAPNIQATGADHALVVEKEFRERQQQLADKITDPKTSSEQRERLELAKTTEYHNHKAEQLSNVIELETALARLSGGNTEPSERAISEHEKTMDHHRSQASLAAQKLHQFDQTRNSVPKEVQARMGLAAQPAHQHNEQSQKDLSRDPHLQSIAHQVAQPSQTKGEQGKSSNKDLPAANNPVAARLLARIQSAGERNDAKTTPEQDKRMLEISANKEKLAATREVQKTEALGHKAEQEQRAVRR